MNDITEKTIQELRNENTNLQLEIENLKMQRMQEIKITSKAFAGSLRANSDIERQSDLKDLYKRILEDKTAPSQEEALKAIGHRYLVNEANDILTLSPAELYKKQLQAQSASGDVSARIEHDLLSKNDISDKRKEDMLKAVKKNLR